MRNKSKVIPLKPPEKPWIEPGILISYSPACPNDLIALQWEEPKSLLVSVNPLRQQRPTHLICPACGYRCSKEQAGAVIAVNDNIYKNALNASQQGSPPPGGKLVEMKGLTFTEDEEVKDCGGDEVCGD